jgi:hypothetical protein
MEDKIISKVDEEKAVKIAHSIIDKVEKTQIKDIASMLNGVTIALASMCATVKNYVDDDRVEELVMTWLSACDGLHKTNFSKFIKLPQKENNLGDIHDKTDVMPTRT